LLLLTTLAIDQVPREVRGIVETDAGPVEAACVRFQATAISTQTDAAGRFTLRGDGQKITAWKAGYFIAGVNVNGSDPLTLRLRPLPQEDNPDYLWVDPRPGRGHHRCANCHAEIFREWQGSAHARSASGPHLLGLYAGTDIDGRPDAGWSLLKEHPHGASVCAACHAPAVALTDPGYEDLRQLTGVARLGTHCDYCHKIAEAPLERLGTAHGRFAYRLLRPQEGQLFFGPLDDVDRNEDAFSPLYKQSQYCASCHEGTVFGAPVYTTYTEWLSSPAGRSGQTCQSCHMAPTGKMTNIAPGHGGVERDPMTLASHDTPGANLTMLRRCLKLRPRLLATTNGWEVQVEVSAVDVGHHVPTGFIDRHLILVVEGQAADGTSIAVQSGPRLSAAVGDATVVGAAGALFAKQIADEAGNQPVPFWQFHRVAADTRLRPGEPQHFRWSFPKQTSVVVVRLTYRRFWKIDADRKRWPDNELVIFEERLAVK
jgi:hypothetical protein